MKTKLERNKIHKIIFLFREREEIFRSAIFLGGNFPGGQLSGAQFSQGRFPLGIFTGGIFPRTHDEEDLEKIN